MTKTPADFYAANKAAIESCDALARSKYPSYEVTKITKTPAVTNAGTQCVIEAVRPTAGACALLVTYSTKTAASCTSWFYSYDLDAASLSALLAALNA